METRYLKTITTIAETGNFLRAAMQLNYAQSTVTTQVQQVEKQLGTKIFKRNGRHLTLTPAGKQAMPIIERLMADVASLYDINLPSDALTGTLTIAVPETLLTYKLQPVLRVFKNAAPDVNLRIHVLNCYDIYTEITAGKANVGLQYDVRNYPPTFGTVTLTQFDLALVASPKLAVKDRDFITPKQDKPVAAIINDANARYTERFDAYLSERGIHMQQPLELWSIETIKQSVENELGVAFLPRFCVADELASGRLLELPIAMTHPTLQVIDAFKKGEMTPATKLFIQLLNQVQDWQAQPIQLSSSVNSEYISGFSDV